ncbi:MAG: ABC transporter ATP-binding protein [Chloroflexi bacterium]|nr:MAG: ABC transporter ATP-binding protein [Chloroflexota bacterium]
MTAQNGNVIETTDLTKRYGDVVAVDHLTLRVPRGGVFGFLGPNGSGKTTTMGMLLGLVHPTSGEARIFGDPARHPATLRRVGAMVETPTFYPYLSGRANLRYFQAIGGRGAPADVDRLLDLVDLGKRAASKYATYSLGMKQRLGIACALLGDPELVFLDEPTNGLDPAGVVEVRELVRDLGKGGRTVVLSSHLLSETELVCDNVAVLSRGKLIAQGSIQELLRQHDGLRLRTTDDAKARATLAEIRWVQHVEPQDGGLMVTAPPDRSWEISRALALREVYVNELMPVHRSLEEFFMEITGTDPATGKERS